MASLMQQFEKYLTSLMDQLAPYEPDLVSQYHNLVDNNEHQMAGLWSLKMSFILQALDVFSDNELMTALAQNDVDRIGTIFDVYSAKLLRPSLTYRSFVNRMDDPTREHMRKTMLILCTIANNSK